MMERAVIREEELQNLANIAAELYFIIQKLSEAPTISARYRERLIDCLQNVFEDMDQALTVTLRENGAVLELT